MDRNSVVGLILIAILLVAYSLYNQPSEEEIAARQRALDSAAAVAAEEEAEQRAREAASYSETATPAPDSTTTANDSITTAAKNAEMQAKYGVFAAVADGEESLITVETDRMVVQFSNRGGVPVQAVLKEFNTYDSLPLVLFDPDLASFATEFTYPSLGNLSTGDFYFTTSAGDAVLEGEDAKQIIFTADLGGGRKLENVYTLSGDRYDIGFESRAYDLDGVFTSPRIIWELSARDVEKSIKAQRNNSTIFYKEEGSGRDYLSETGDDDETVKGKLRWMAFKMNFFSTVLLADNPLPAGAELESHPYEESVDSLTQYYRAEMPLSPSGSTLFSGQLIFGPNDYKVLKEYGHEMDKIINLGWGIFGWVNKFVVIPIFDLLEKTDLSYGIIILILTVVIKLVLSPLTLKNYISSAKMRVLKPEIEEINEKYKDADPMKKQQATMDLYRKAGVNPASGCLPMLVQMPILYAMFRFFPSSIELRQESFLWADDLSSYDSILDLPFSIPLYGDHVSLFTLLMAASTMIYTLINQKQMPTQQGMPGMKLMLYMFPIMMLFFLNNFSAGLSYYYLLANLISILQMTVFKRWFIDEDKIRAELVQNMKTPRKKSRWQQRMEELQKQQQAQAKARRR